MREPSDGLRELEPEQLRNMVRRYKVRSSQLEAELATAKDERDQFAARLVQLTTRRKRKEFDDAV